MAPQQIQPPISKDLNASYDTGESRPFLTAFFAAILVTQTERGDDVFFAMLNGAAAQIEDVGALGVLR